MKEKIKITLLVIMLVTPLIIPVFATATEGACSWHGGVNCGAGPDWDGSVICNDGWKDSSVKYSSTIECTINCSSYLYHTGCKDQSDLGALAQEYAERGLAFSGMRVAAENSCMAEIQEYEQKKLDYQQCLNKQEEIQKLQQQTLLEEQLRQQQVLEEQLRQSAQQRALEGQLRQYIQQQAEKTATILCPQNSSYDSSINQCRCYTGYVISNGNCVVGDYFCQSSINGSRYSNGHCVCNEGFILRNNQCITYMIDCQLSFGEHVLGSKGDSGNSSCNCEVGYNWNNTKTACVKIETKTALPPQNSSQPKPQVNIVNPKLKEEIIPSPESKPKKDETEKIEQKPKEKPVASAITENKSDEGSKGKRFIANIFEAAGGFFKKIFNWF